jgi:hypothetical protein
MKSIPAIILFGVISLCLTHSVTVCSAADCFQRIENTDLPFEIYHGRYGIFLRQDKSNDSPSEKESPFLEYNDAQIVQLCDQNFVAIWMFSHHRYSIPLTGRIFDKQQKIISKDFPISESSEFDGWEYSVAPLYDNGFVVTWKERKKNKKNELVIRARIFESSGLPRGSSFDVSRSTGSHNGGAVVRGLPNGAFVVSWNRFKVGTYLRIFARDGKPKTNEIFVVPDLDGGPYCGQNPHIYVTNSGIINIFMSCVLRSPDEKYLFDCARSFDSNGKPITSKLTGEQMVGLEGYRRLVEQYVKKEAVNFGFMRNLSGIQLHECSYGSIVKADQMKTLSNDRRMKEFFTGYCESFREPCSNANAYVRSRIEQCIK